MKVKDIEIGILGGLGPEATIEYYRLFTELYRKREPSGAYARLLIRSMDLQEFFRMAEQKEWTKVVQWLVEGVRALERAGAEIALIASNTPHIVFDEIEARVSIPMISIVRETIRVAGERGLARLGLFGTKFTMEATFYRDEAAARRIDVFVPENRDQVYIHSKLVEEIAVGTILDETRAGLVEIVRRMKEMHGIDGLILGCTELPLILTGDAAGVVFLNTTKIHVESTVDRIFEHPA
jgi:aspartate racemase